MLKNVVKDYFQDCNLKSAKENSFHLFYFVLLFCMQIGVVIGCGDSERLKSAGIMCLVFLPMLCSDFAMVLHPVQLHKMMYLCPLSREERKAYVKNTYIFRVVIHVVLSILCVAIVSQCSYCDLLSAILLLLNDILFACLIFPKRAFHSVVNPSFEHWMWFFLILFALGSNFLQVYIVMDEAEDWWLKWTLLIVFLTIQLPMALRYRICVRQRLDEVGDFEGEMS